MYNKNKNHNCHSGHPLLCHPELVSGSMFGSAWKVEDNLNGSCQRVNGFRTKSGMTGECGRSMVEMLGVLAIIGVLSVGGIAGYTMAMNKHRANEILNAASVRAMVVSTQIQNGTSPTLVEFGSEKVGNVSITLNPYTTGDATFSFSLATVDESVCSQMKAVVPDNSQNPVIDCEASPITMTYNADLGSGASSTELPSCDSCGTGAGPCVQYNGSCVPKFYKGTEDKWNNLNSMTEVQRCPNGGRWATLDDLALFGCPSSTAIKVDDTCSSWPECNCLEGWVATVKDDNYAWDIYYQGVIDARDRDGRDFCYTSALCVR